MLCCLLIWLIAMTVQWIYVIDGIRQASKDGDPATRLATFQVIAFAAIPPTCFLIMLVGSEAGLQLWFISFERWEALFSVVRALAICYLLWAVISFVTNHQPWMRAVIVVSFVTCLTVWPLLALLRSAG